MTEEDARILAVQVFEEFLREGHAELHLYGLDVIVAFESAYGPHTERRDR